MIVDASVWVAYFYGRDHYSSATVPWLETLLFAGERLSAPSLVLAEVGGALDRRTSPDLGRLVVERLRATPQLTLVPMTDDLMALATELAIALPARGANSVYIATARLLGQPLVTWDREQHDLGGSVVATLFPGELQS